MMHQNDQHDPVEIFQRALAQPPTERCEHIGHLTVGQPAVRDWRTPFRITCTECLTKSFGTAVCGSCGTAEPDMLFVLFPESTDRLWLTGMACRTCSGYLPADAATWDQDADGELRVNRPGGGAR